MRCLRAPRGAAAHAGADGPVPVDAPVANQGRADEGTGGALRLDTGGDGRGLSLSLLPPSWGAVESGLSRLWEDGVTGRAPGAALAAARLDAELGYGFGLEEGDARRYRVGTRLGLGDGLDLSLEAERKKAAAPDQGTRLDLRIRW